MRVADVEGVEWEVSRRWLELPRWRFWRPRDLGSDVGLYDEDIVVTIFLIALVLAFVLVGIPILVFLVAFVVAVLGLAARILFGRPWLVEAKSARGELQWRVRGMARSRAAMEEIAAALRRGDRSYTPAGAERLLPDSPLRQ